MTIPVDKPQKNWRVFVSSMCASMRHRGAREFHRPRRCDERRIPGMSGDGESHGGMEDIEETSVTATWRAAFSGAGRLGTSHK
jgi:hypothetical protein